MANKKMKTEDLKAYIKAYAEKAKADAVLKKLRPIIIEVMGDRDVYVNKDLNISLIKSTSERNTLDVSKLKKELPDVYSDHLKTSTVTSLKLKELTVK